MDSVTICLYGGDFCRQTDGGKGSQAPLSRCVLAALSEPLCPRTGERMFKKKLVWFQVSSCKSFTASNPDMLTENKSRNVATYMKTTIFERKNHL